MGDAPLASEAGCSLAILARVPIPGYAKTRLIPRLGAEGAAELHGVLVRRTVETAIGAGLSSVAVWCAPGRGDPFFQRLASTGEVDLHDQPDGDLGHRMFAAFRAHLARGAPALLVGTDCPGLTAGHLRSARAALAGRCDAVLIPAEDGGYALLGLNRLDRRLFDGVPWGTAAVLADTRTRLRDLGWSAHELAPLRDVDRPKDVDWLLGSGLLEDDDRRRLARLASLEA